MITTNQINWIAGLLEGEGCFDNIKTRPHFPRIRISMTDEDVVIRARSIMGPDEKVNIRKDSKRNAKHKDIYYFSVYGSKAIQWMMTIYPLMGRRRKERIREAIYSWKSHSRKHTEAELAKLKAIRFIAKCRKVSSEEARNLYDDVMKVK